MTTRERKAAWLLLAGLLLAGTAPARAQEVTATYGDWVFGADSELAAASTANEDGQMLGLVCSPNCLLYISSEMPCREGAQYDGTMESTLGDQPTRFLCRLVEGRFALLATPTEALIDATRQAETLRFRVPLESGMTTFRFSLNGAYRAIYAALERAMALAGTPVT